MLGGLDYHHDNFMHAFCLLAPYYERLFSCLRKTNENVSGESLSPFPTGEERKLLESLDHEALAYINRLGQFHAFAKSRNLKSLLPRASELMVFRNKHAAHRSIDDPRKEDNEHLQEAHAFAFGWIQHTIAGFPVFQIRDCNAIVGIVELHVRDDHRIIMDEVLKAFQTLHCVQSVRKSKH